MHRATLVTLHCSAHASLCTVQFVIEAVQCHQLCVCSVLYYVAIVHDKNDIGIADSRQAMCDDETGATMLGSVQRLLNDLQHVTFKQMTSHKPRK